MQKGSSVQVGNSRAAVAAGLVGADLLVLFKGEQGQAHGVVLGQRFADHLPVLIGHLIGQPEDGGFFNIFHAHGKQLLYQLLPLL